jgi:hypothetical protein
MNRRTIIITLAVDILVATVLSMSSVRSLAGGAA